MKPTLWDRRAGRNAPCMFGWLPYVWTSPCLDAPCMFGCPPVCLDAPVFLDPPICLDTPICLDAPICFNIPHMFGCPSYDWMAPYILTPSFVRCKGCPYAPNTFVHPCMFGWPNMFGHPSMFVCPHMFKCPLYIHNTKKVWFVRLRGCSYAPIHLDAPCMFGCP